VTRAAQGGPDGAIDRGRALAERTRVGERRALARLLTEVENRSRAAEAALRILYPLAGAAHLVGVTGAPGAGKSTLVAALVGEARKSGRPVAVLAIDPSSPITGGAILGDRVRMQAYAGDPDVFIRSMASRGHVGGLANSTVAAAAVLDAAGFPLVFIETVGTGQSEVEVAAIADTTLVVQAPEMGDEVQAIKAGLLEVADIVVVNKADRPGADRTASHLRSMLTVGAQHDRAMGDRPRPKRPEVLLASGAGGTGVPEVLASLDRREAKRRAAASSDEAEGVGDRARLARAAAQLSGILAERLRERLREPGLAAQTDETLRAIAAHEIDPYSAADRLLASLAATESDEPGARSLRAREAITGLRAFRQRHPLDGLTIRELIDEGRR
jgi:LAO/AO transport system kinase